jgi:hypothetical protein
VDGVVTLITAGWAIFVLAALLALWLGDRFETRDDD